jgi:hypothetical protein
MWNWSACGLPIKKRKKKKRKRRDMKQSRQSYSIGITILGSFLAIALNCHF